MGEAEWEVRMSGGRVLMVCYYFPPIGGIASVRALRAAQLLPDFGWVPSVVAPRRGAFDNDPSLELAPCEVRRTPAAHLRYKRRRGTEAFDAPSFDGHALAGGLRRFLHRYLFRPDAQIGWYPFGLRAGRQLLRDNPFDLVFSSSVPITAHLIAAKLRREFRLPWVAEFRDPWAEAAGPHPLPYSYRDQLERRILNDATGIVTVSPSWAEMFRARGGRSVSVVMNGSDSAGGIGGEADLAPHLAYVGSFYPGLQSLEVIWRALQELRASKGVLGLKLVGRVHPSLRRELERFGLWEGAHKTGFVTQARAKAEMSAAAALLLAGPSTADSSTRGWIPAKTFEYLASGRPIVHVGRSGTDLHHLLSSQPGCFFVEPHDTHAAKLALTRAAEAGAVHRRHEGLDRRSQVEALAAAFDGALGESVR